METTYPVKQAFQKTSYQKSPEEQRKIARAVAVNNVFENLTLEEKLHIANEEDIRNKMFQLAVTIENWLVR